VENLPVLNRQVHEPTSRILPEDEPKLEEHLTACVAGMMKIALAARSRSNAQEKKEQARQKRIDEVTAELEKIEAEERKIKTLRKEVIAWQRAKRIREYVAAVREEADRKTDADGRAKVLEWIEWAERQADRSDPMKSSPPSIVDDKEKVIRRLRSVEGYWWAEPVPNEDV
jgi:predicted transcriptional regulator